MKTKTPPNVDSGTHAVHAGVRGIASTMFLSIVALAAFRFSGWLAAAVFLAYVLGFVNAGVVDIARRKCRECTPPGSDEKIQ